MTKEFSWLDLRSAVEHKPEPLDFVIRLANETAVVLLNGDGFAGPDWSVRISLANLARKSYLKIGTAIRTILNEYHDEFRGESGQPNCTTK